MESKEPRPPELYAPSVFFRAFPVWASFRLGLPLPIQPPAPNNLRSSSRLRSSLPSKPSPLRRPALAEGEPEGRERAASGPANRPRLLTRAKARAVAPQRRGLTPPATKPLADVRRNAEWDNGQKLSRR